MLSPNTDDTPASQREYYEQLLTIFKISGLLPNEEAAEHRYAEKHEKSA